jgi:hypothetical protein
MVLRMMAGPSGRKCGGDTTPNRVSIQMRIFGLRENGRRVEKPNNKELLYFALVTKYC